MSGEGLNDFERLVGDVKRYAALKTDEYKLRTTRGLAAAFGQVLSYLLIFVVLSIVLGLLAYAQLQWLNSLVGAPWGTLIVLGVFLVLLVLLIIFRRKLFRNIFVRLFIDVFYDSSSDSDGKVL